MDNNCGNISHCLVGHEFCFDGRCKKCADFNDTACNTTLQSNCYAHCEDISKQKCSLKIKSLEEMYRAKLEAVQGQLSEYQVWSYVFYGVIALFAIVFFVMIILYIKAKLSQKYKRCRTDTELNSQVYIHDEEVKKQPLKNANAISAEVDETNTSAVSMPPEHQRMTDANGQLKQIKPRDDPNDGHCEEPRHRLLPSAT